MIVELTKDNLKELENSFINLQEIGHELKINPFAKILIYKETNKVIGYLYYSDIYNRAEINQIEIAVLHRGCGKASELLKRMIDTVEKNITLEVKENNVAALNLYKKFNFVKRAIRKGYYQGINGILMEREVNKRNS